MKPYQQRFIELALSHQALRFGEFTLKSGRQSPYFFNAGTLYNGKALKILGECYAKAIADNHLNYDLLYGPAYKGIPLVCATAMALEAPFCFNRKEVKDHVEGGQLVGAPLQGKVIIIDDVITAGTAIRESFTLLKPHPVEVVGVMVALNRQEKGQGNISAIQEIEETFSVPVKAIITLKNILDFVASTPEFVRYREPLLTYQAQYGQSG